MALFSGVLIFVKLSYILGNLVSSTVLLFNRQKGADGPWVTATCNTTEVANVDEMYLHILLSMCIVSLVAAIVMLFLWTTPAQREELSPCESRKKHTIWLKGNPRRSKTVGNRVSDIIELTPPTCWRMSKVLTILLTACLGVHFLPS